MRTGARPRTAQHGAAAHDSNAFKARRMHIPVVVDVLVQTAPPPQGIAARFVAPDIVAIGARVLNLPHFTPTRLQVPAPLGIRGNFMHGIHSAPVVPLQMTA